MSFKADFTTLFTYKPVFGFCTHTDSPEFYYEDNAHDFVKKNQNTIANIIKIASYLPVFGIVTGVCHFTAIHISASSISDSHQIDLAFRGFLEIINGISGSGLLIFFFDCITMLGHEYPPSLVTPTKLRTILDNVSDPQILTKKFKNLIILDPKQIPSDEREIWNNVIIDAFPYFNFSAQQDMITYYKNEDLIIGKGVVA